MLKSYKLVDNEVVEAESYPPTERELEVQQVLKNQWVR